MNTNENTPTDDEREALERVLTSNFFYAYEDPSVRELADAILAAGFRRSEVPEPPCEHGSPLSAIRNHGGWDMGLQSKSYPPDAVVSAALAAWNATGGSDRVAMRAALRAAGGAP